MNEDFTRMCLMSFIVVHFTTSRKRDVAVKFVIFNLQKLTIQCQTQLNGFSSTQEEKSFNSAKWYYFTEKDANRKLLDLFNKALSICLLFCEMNWFFLVFFFFCLTHVNANLSFQHTRYYICIPLMNMPIHLPFKLFIMNFDSDSH